MPTKKITFEAAGLTHIKREAQDAAKAIERLEKLYKDAVRAGGKAGENAKNIFRQQILSVRERTSRLSDYRQRFETSTDPGSRDRLGGLMERTQIGIQRVAARGETVAGQAGLSGVRGIGGGGGGRAGARGGFLRGMMGGGMGRALQAGPVVGGAILAGMALMSLAKIAKQASDAFAAHQDRLLDFSRGLSASGNFMNMTTGIGGRMRAMGFGQGATVGFAGQITGAAGMRGGSESARMMNLQQDIVGGGRLARMFGMSGGGGAALMGGARGAGMDQGGLGGFLGGIGGRARAQAPSVAGRVDQFLKLSLDYLKTIATTLQKGEQRGAIDLFARLMGGLESRGPQFGGNTGQKIIQSVDEVMKSGSGIIGGMFARFMMSRTAQEGGTQIDVLRRLDKGIAATDNKGKPFFVEFVKQIANTNKSLANVAAFLQQRTGRPFAEMEAFLQTAVGVDLSDKKALEKFTSQMENMKFETEGDKLRTAAATMEDALLEFGRSIPIFRQATILLGDAASIMLKDERVAFMKRSEGKFGGLNQSTYAEAAALGQRLDLMNPLAGQSAGIFQRGKMSFEHLVSQKFSEILQEGPGSPTGRVKLDFNAQQSKLLAQLVGGGSDIAQVQNTEEFKKVMTALLEFLAVKTMTPAERLEVVLYDQTGKPLGRGEASTVEKK